METARLTKRAILGLELPTKGNQILYPDPEQAHHYVRVTRGGARAFVVDKNTARFGRIRIKLGDAGTDSFTTTQAQKKCRAAVSLIEQGYTAEQVRAQLAGVEDKVPEGAMTLKQVFDQYLLERGHKLSPRTKSDYQKLIDTHLADWKDRPIELIDETAVVAKFVSIKSPARANYAFRVVRLLFNYAASIRGEEGRPIVNGNPVIVLSQRRIWHEDKPSREVIELAALKPWWRAVRALETEATKDNVDTVRDWLVFLLLTGLRRNEAATLKWANVDLKSKMFTIPVTKNREPHTLPLSDFLLAMLKRRHAAMLKEENPRLREYVFPGEVGALAEPKKLIAKVVAESGVKFSAHTLRRTFASIAESLDIPYLALKRLLNHKAQDITGKHYTVIGAERLRDPMQRITNFILKAAGERKSAKVVELKQRRAA
jgi:integrase